MNLRRNVMPCDVLTKPSYCGTAAKSETEGKSRLLVLESMAETPCLQTYCRFFLRPPPPPFPPRASAWFHVSGSELGLCYFDTSSLHVAASSPSSLRKVQIKRSDFQDFHYTLMQSTSCCMTPVAAGSPANLRTGEDPILTLMSLKFAVSQH